ncbi:MAG: NAD(P)/FAD-dependent oxidoreductase [Hydrogenophaga sp.]
MSYQFDVVVIGAGVVGLACAKYLVEQGCSTLVVESEAGFGTGTSSRNSEVIHAGIYYEQNSHKARLSVRGKHLLYEYCLSRGIPHKKMGKWIVAQNETQVQKLHQLQQAGKSNGVDDLQFLLPHAICTGEPSLKAREVLYSPSTGIVDSHAYMQSLVNDIESGGGVIVYKTPFEQAQATAQGFEIRLGGADQATVHARHFINAAGLHALSVAKDIEGLAANHIPQACFAKGNYYAYMGQVPFKRLIYPVPETGGLGIHLTLDMGGQARFGPDVEWVDKIDYQVNDISRQKFAQAIQTYWPACDPSKLAPAYSGIRPKLGTPQHFSSDFVIQTGQDHGVAGLVNLFGIESPGLTASLAIAEQVSSIVEKVSH